MEHRLLLPEEPRALLVLGHGAGAGMDHPFMVALGEALRDRGVATFSYNFPYREDGGRGWPPDPPEVLVDRVREAVALAREKLPELPLFAGGKSMGGRMTSTAAAQGALPDYVEGLVFFGFPLHSKKRRSTRKGEHLKRVRLPMLFLQGTRDDLADLELLRPLVEELGEGARLHEVVGADHSFRVLKRSGRSGAEVLKELAGEAPRWMEEGA